VDTVRTVSASDDAKLTGAAQPANKATAVSATATTATVRRTEKPFNL
jgi:hypothetical protein